MKYRIRQPLRVPRRTLGDVPGGTMNPVQYFNRVENRRGVTNPLASQGIPYTQGDPNAFPQDVGYSEAIQFNGASFPLTGNLAGSSSVQKSIGEVKGFYQDDHFAVRLLPASGCALSFNPKRIALTLQNQESAGGSVLYFQLATNVGSSNGNPVGISLQPGEGYVFDNGCVPCDDVYIAWVGGAGSGVVMEGTRGPQTRMGNPNGIAIGPGWGA